MSENDLFADFRTDRQNLSARLFDSISRQIIRGELPSGYCFPNENEMCERLGIGRSSLREAYAMLAQFGYLRRTKRGTYVNSLYEIIRSAPLSATVQDASPEEYKAFRILIEGETARRAAMKAAEADIDALRRQLERFDPAAPLEALAEADMGFHLSIAQLSRNVLLCNTIIAVSSAWKQGVLDGFQKLKNQAPETLPLVQRQHQAVFDAIAARDPERARQAMADHLNAAIAET